MPTLWGSKKDDDQPRNGDRAHDNGEGGRPASGEHEREPDERTRLIPREHHEPPQGGYLSPDDPAVSYIHEGIQWLAHR